MTIEVLMPPDLLFLQPVVVDMVRFGSEHDGGYVGSPACIEPSVAVISFGLKDDWSFEQSIYRQTRNVLVHSYDPTVSMMGFVKSLFLGLRQLILVRDLTLWGRFKVLLSYVTFFGHDDRQHYKQWVRAEEGDETTISLQGVLTRLGAERSAILKIDIEGDEYCVLEEFLRLPDNHQVNALFVEFHELDRNWMRFRNIVESLRVDFTLIHLHTNNNSKVLTDTGVPSVLELSFLRNKFVVGAARRRELPLQGLDFPNDAGSEDYRIVFAR